MNALKLTVASLLAVAGLLIWLYQGRDLSATAPRSTASRPVQAITVAGPLSTISPDTFRVGGRRVTLCGVRFAQAPHLSDTAGRAIAASYDRRPVRCVQVGGGTPCDGLTGTATGSGILAQCTLEGGQDLALDLIERNMLCGLLTEDVPYKRCE